MAIDEIIRASKRVVGGERLLDGTRLPPLRAYMDDTTTLTSTAPCSSLVLTKLNEGLK